MFINDVLKNRPKSWSNTRLQKSFVGRIGLDVRKRELWLRLLFTLCLGKEKSGSELTCSPHSGDFVLSDSRTLSYERCANVQSTLRLK